MSARPWRAVAYLAPEVAPGMFLPPIVIGRTSARERAGLDAFVDRHAGSGSARVTVWRVQSLEDAVAELLNEGLVEEAPDAD